MVRTSIFDKLNANVDLEKEFNRLDTLFSSIKCIYATLDKVKYSFTMRELIDHFYFSQWANRGHCLNLSDFLETFDYEEKLLDIPYDEETFIDLMELFYNLYQLINENIKERSLTIRSSSDYDLFKKILDDILEYNNLTTYYNSQLEQMLITRKDEAVTAVVEIEEDSSLAFEIVQYNHHALKGDIAKKKAILFKLGAQLEPKRKELDRISPRLSENIFTFLNNLNIRHNNIEPGNSKHKQCVVDMKPEELENWYDELYQMILLARLELDNVERMKKADELRKNF